MSRETIAVDIDDVLASHYEALAGFMNERYGHDHTAADYNSSLDTLWGVPKEEAVRRMFEFHETDPLGSFTVKPEAVSVIERLETRYDLIVVTARPRQSVETTHDWLNRHFPSVFKRIAFIHPWEGDQTTKADKCLELEADYLVDDVLSHCEAAAGIGVSALLFGVHERVRGLPEGITPVLDWPEVEEFFDARG